MTEQTGFAISVAQNPYLAPEETTMHAVVTVGFAPAEDVGAEVAEIIVIDRSGSMAGPKFTEAKRAAKAALGAIREDAHFALIAGGTGATELYPGGGRLAAGTEEHKRAAAAAVDAMKIGSATSIGTWLRRAADIASSRPGAIGHVLLLTDGQVNQHPARYDADLAYCEGRFTCDAVGIGTGWNAEELRRIAQLFHGTRNYCKDLPDLAEFFTRATDRAMARAVDEVELTVKGPKGFEVTGLWEAFPTERDLLPRGREAGARRLAFPLGAWGAEERQYLIEAAFPATGVDLERQARLELVCRERAVAAGSVRAIWTGDAAMSSAFHPAVVHHRTQLTGIAHIREALERLHRAPEAATRLLVTALEGAREVGNAEQAEQIERLLDFDGRGGATIRAGITRSEELEAHMVTDRTVRTPTSLEEDTQ
ncbi:vWA domain-containing protein [Glycomyces tenuis]|uniref:vWA domain-containing protein n=1 Tax=Glycomyces tenuis TaxID=58116 RepID=UPI0004273145|nr:vWA domain-containing protein [Glycomyces tenuis]